MRMAKTELFAGSKKRRLEAVLLRCCARSRPDACVIGQIRQLLRQEIDWDYLIESADKHGLLPLLYWNLCAAGPDGIPPARAEQLRHIVYVRAGRSILMARELLHLISLFKRHGIPAFPYKGPILAATLYGDLTLRQYSDVDLVVKQADVLRAQELLIDRGYRPERPRADDQAAAKLKTGHALHFVHDGNKTLLDLHWRITPENLAVPLDLEALWQRLEPASLEGSTVQNLSPEVLLLVLCIHASKPRHFWRRLSWISDLAELLQTYPQLDWERVLADAKLLRGERMLYLGLFLAENQLGVRLPPLVKERSRFDPIPKLLAAYIGRRLFSDTSDTFRSFDSSLCYLLLQERWRG